MRAVFRIDFDSSFFDGLLIRTLFHRCAQCFVDMILFDPTSPSVKSYQLLLRLRLPSAAAAASCCCLLLLPPAAASSCCCCCLLLLLLLLPPAAAAASSCCCCCLLLLLLLPPAAAAAASSSSCCCFLLPPPPAAAAAGANISPKKKITVSVALFGAGGRYGRETPAERGNVYRRQNL